MKGEKKYVNRRVLLATLAALVLAGPAWAEKTAKGPLKVFILAGQSNMEGHGRIAGSQKGTLETLSKDPATAARYKHLLDKDGNWIVRDDVWLSYYDTKCPLTIGKSAARNAIGPELSFGWVVGDQYKGMIAGVKKQLDNLKTDFPDYDGRGYEFAGFVWFHGWNDMCTRPAVPEYEQNVVNLINDVRKEFKAPKLPVIIGELGNGGRPAKGAMLAIRKAQAAAAERPEFKGNVLFVKTAEFARPREQSPNTGHGHHWFGNAECYFLIGNALGEGMKTLLDKE